MTLLQPKLRSDLELREQVSPQGRVVVIKDPANGEFFRLQKAERFIAQQFDGETPLETIRSRAERKFGAPLEPGALTSFVETLDRYGLLETKDGSHRRSKRRRLNGGLLNLRFRLFDPARLFNRLLPRIRFFFTPQFVFLSACLICAAAAVTILNWGDILAEASRLYSFSTLPLLLVTVFIILTCHEFAHGLTCKHFGGEVRDMGFLLIYLQPAFYCNVSDAWLFSKKSKRLWVGFAGPFFELFLWALATLAWRATDTGTLISHISLVVMATSGIKTLFNFNPLIKLDGYYLLSDWLDIPNLRRKSFRYLGEFFRCLGGLVRPLPEVPRRERRIFLTYGLIAWVGSVSFLSYGALLAGEYLMMERERVAFLALTGFVGFRFRRKFRRLFGRKSDDPEDDDGTGSPPVPSGDAPVPSGDAPVPSDNAPVPSGDAPIPSGDAPIPSGDAPIPSGDVPVPSGDAPVPATTGGAPDRTKVRTKERSKRSKRRIAWVRRLILKLVVGTVLVLLLFLVRTELRVAGPINVLPHQNADVRTEIDGIIEEIYVTEGQSVSKGELIARLFDRDVRTELEKIESQIDQSQARLKLLEVGARTEEIQLAQNSASRAEEQLRFGRDRLGRDRLLYEQQLLSLNDYEDTARQVAGWTSDLAEAKKKLELLLAGSRPEEIDAMKATLASLETERRHLEAQLRLMRVISPAAGVVTTPARQLKEMKHQFVGKGDLVAKVHDFQTITAEIAVSEKEIADVHPDQAVALKVRAYPEDIFHGKVIAIATTTLGAAASSSTKTGSSGGSSGDPKSVSTILVTTEIDNSDGLLKPGMTGMAKVYCGERRIIDLVTRRLSRTFRVEFWSWW